MDAIKPTGRVTALDAARGIAILMMAYVHMVPSDGGAFAAKVTLALEGKAAVLFFILAGFFVAALVQRQGLAGMVRNRLRRLGLPFALFWPPLFVACALHVRWRLHRAAREAVA